MTPSPESILDNAWSDLARATEDPAHPWRLAALATIGLNGSPQTRTVVVREADPAQQLLLFHTDARSPKAREIARDSRVALLFYDPARRIQLRGQGLATLHRDDDPRAERLWSRANDPQRRAYLRPERPGAPVPERTAPSGPSIDPPDDWGRARERFLAIGVLIDEWDWLELGETEHLRARFARDRSTSTWRAEWIAP